MQFGEDGVITVTKHPVNICFAAPREDPFVTYHDAALGRVFVLMAQTVGYELWPWARWQKDHGLGARYALRASTEAQLAAFAGTLGQLSDEYDDVKWWQRVQRVIDSDTATRRARVTCQFLKYLGIKLPFELDEATSGRLQTALLDSRVAMRML